MDFFKSSSSSSTSSASKPAKKSTSSTNGSGNKPSGKPNGGVVVSAIRRKVPSSSSSTPSGANGHPPRTHTSNALPIQVRARIEAARAAEREREIEREAEAQVIKRKSSSKKRSRKDDFISDDEDDKAAVKSKSKAKKKARDSVSDSDDDLFGSPSKSTPKSAGASRSGSASSSRFSTPQQQSAYTYLGRSGVVQPYLVPREIATATSSSYESFVAEHGEPVSSATLVTSAMTTLRKGSVKQWGAFFKDLPTTPPPKCTLEYPAKGASEEFILLVAKDSDEYDPISDLLRSVYVIVKHYLTPLQREAFGQIDELEMASAAGNVWTGPLEAANDSAAPTPDPTGSGSKTAAEGGSLDTSSILRSFTKARNRRSGTIFLRTVDRFNAALVELREKGALQENIRSAVEKSGVAEDIWNRVQDQAYARSVAPRVDELASYRSFSDNVYGELTPRFMSEIAQLCDLKPSSTMVDLGCGVGNLVIQAALQVGCKSVGIEAMPSPAALGSLQVSEARKRWAMWDLLSAGGEMSLWKGDFLEDVSIRSHMREASVVVVNNYAFTPPLNESLSLLFLDLPNHCKIVSLKPFVPHDFRLTERTAGSPSSILSVQEREYGKGMVSWTERGGKYYIATVDRSQVERFMQDSESRNTTPRKRRGGS